MSHRRDAPFVPIVFGKEHKGTRRKLAKLIALRFAYGKSTFFDSHTHKSEYPVELVAKALIECVAIAKKCDEQLELSTDEFRLWRQMFPLTGSGRSKPDHQTRQVSK